MAQYKLGVDSSSKVKIYTSDTVPDGITLVGGISGLKEGLAATAGQAYSLPSGITATATDDGGNKNVTVTLGEGAGAQLEGGTTISVSASGSNTVSLTVDEKAKSKANGYSLDTTTAGKIIIKHKFTAGWTANGTTSASYNDEITARPENAVTLSGGGLKNETLASSDYSFNDSSTVITLNSSAFKSSLTGDETVTVGSGFTLVLGTGVSAAAKEPDTKYSWSVSGGADEEKTATLQKVLTAGWAVNDTAGATTLTYKAEKTLNYASITGMAAGTTAEGLASLLPNQNVSNAVIALVKANIPTVTDQTKTEEVILANATSVSIPGYAVANGTTTTESGSATPTFTLALGSDINKAPQTKTDGTLALTFNSLESGATVKTANITQHMNAGWTLDTVSGSNTENKKITYTPARNFTLATLDGVNPGAVAGTHILFGSNPATADDNAITLQSGALIKDSAQPFTLTLADTSTGTITLAGYEASDKAYTLVLGNSVETNSAAKIADTLNVNFDSVEGNASIAPILLDYFTLSDSTIVSYTAVRPSDTLAATLSGLSSTAAFAINNQNATGANVFVTTSNGNVVFKDGSVVIANNKSIKLTDTDATDSIDFKLKLGDNLASVATTQSNPTITGFTDTNWVIHTKPNAGFSLAANNGDTNTTTYTYVTPATLPMATISGDGLSSGATTGVSLTTNNYKTTVTFGAGALNNGATLASAPNISLAYDDTNNKNGENYAFAFALGAGVDSYATNATLKSSPKLVVKSDDTVNTAKVVVYDSAGWKVNGLSIFHYNENVPVDVASVTGLGASASVDADSNGYDNIFFNASTKTISLSKAAFAVGNETYQVSLVSADPIAGYNADLFSGYKLSLGADVKAAGASYSNESVSVENGTAIIKGNLAEGWSLNDSVQVITYTPSVPGADMATITGLDTVEGVKDNITIADKNDSVGNRVITLSKGAFIFNDDSLEGASVAGSAKVSLTNESSIVGANFILALKNSDSTTAESIGFEKNYGWAVNGTNAQYNQANEEGWTQEDNYTITYTPRVDPTTFRTNQTNIKNLLTVDNLAAGLSVDTIVSGNDTITAVGVKPGDTFYQGLWISGAPSGSNKGTITVNRRALNTAATSKTTIALGGDDSSKYAFSLDTLASGGESTFVPTVARTKYTWEINGTTANYRQYASQYWAVNNDTKIVYTPQGSANTIAQITGLASGLSAVASDDYATANLGASATITGSYVYLASDVNKAAQISLTADYTDANAAASLPATIGKITLGKDALTSTKAQITTGKDKYGLLLDTVSATASVAAPVLSNAKWSVSGSKNTAIYTASLTAGYTLTDRANDDSYKSVSFTASGNHTLASITGLKSSLAAAENKITGISVNDTLGTIGLSAAVLSTGAVKLTNGTDVKYVLTLGDDVVDSTDSVVSSGMDVWRLNNTTATYRHITPAYYMLAGDSLSISYKGEDAPDSDIYATISKLRSGLVQENDKIVSVAGGVSLLDVTTAYSASASTTPGVITVKQAALSTAAVTITNGSKVKYVMALDDDVAQVSITGTPAFTVSNGTATYAGSLTGGWGINGASTTITHYNARNNYTIATINGLNTSLANADGISVSGASFIMTQDSLFGGKDVTLGNKTKPDGTAFNYTITLGEAVTSVAATAQTGDNRWYFDDKTDTTLYFGKVHDAHYVQGTKTVDSVETADLTTIKYVPEGREAPDFTIKNLASGLKLNDSDGNGYYKKNDGANPVSIGSSTNGITADYSAHTLTMSAAVVTSNPSIATVLENGSHVLSENLYKFKEGSDLTEQKKENMLSMNGSTLTLYNANTEGYTVYNTSIVYSAADGVTANNTLAAVTGLNSGLTVNGMSVGTVDSLKAFTPAVTYGDNVFSITGGAALDNKDHTTIAVTGRGYSLYNGLADSLKPAEGVGLIVDNTTVSLNGGSTAGWTNGTGDDEGNIVYKPANFNSNIAILSGLKSGLKASDDHQKLVNSSKKDAVTFDKVTGGGYSIMLTSYALNKQDVLLNKAEGVAYNVNLSLFQGLKNVTIDGTATTTPDTLNGYVNNSDDTHVWSKDTSKVVYTITTPEGYNVSNSKGSITSGSTSVAYDAIIDYVKADKKTATLTGLDVSKVSITGSGDGNTITNISLGSSLGSGDISVAAAALNQTTVKLANSKTDYTLVLSGVPNSNGRTWDITKGTATYAENYPEKSYIKKSDTEYTYSAASKAVNLLTISGFDKTISVTGAADSRVKSDYGISIATTKLSSLYNLTEESIKPNENGDTDVDVVKLTDRTKLAGGNVVLKNLNGSDYVLYADVSTDQPTLGSVNDSIFSAAIYSASAPLWAFNKGTLTLSEGNGESWMYKQTGGTKTTVESDDVYDYKTLVYTKAKTTPVATVKGLNTALTLDNGALKTNDSLVAVSLNVDSSLTGSEDTPYEIQLTPNAVPATIKNNTKITLTLPKATKTKLYVTQYTLANSGFASVASASAAANNFDKLATPYDEVWSATNGVASYQYDTSSGWTFDDKTVTYTTKKTTVLAKISGLDKAVTTFTGAKVNNKATDVPLSIAEFKTKTGIEVETGIYTDDGDDLTTFTLKSKNSLAGGKISLTTVDKSGMKYYVLADESLASEEYDPKWTVTGTAGKAVLTAGTTAGYSNPEPSDRNYDRNYGKVVNYTAEKASTTYATVTGLKRDAKTEPAETQLAKLIADGALTFDMSQETIQLANDSILGGTTVSIANGKIPGTKDTYGFTFDADALKNVSGSSIDTDTTPTLKIKSGTLNVVETAEAGKYALSADATKLVYNKNKSVDTILATVKGLNKNVGVYTDGKIYLTTTTGKGKDAVTTYDTLAGALGGLSSGVITLKEGALNNANVTFTLGKGLEDGTYTLSLDEGVTTDSDEINTTGWTISKGTATYKNYDKGYYYDDEKGGFKYKGATKGTTYATITGLNTALTDASIASFGDSGEIVINDAMLINKDAKGNTSGKNVTLSNKKAKDGISGDFTLKLGDDLTQQSSLQAGTSFVKGKLTGTQSAGYFKASDTQITYLRTPKTQTLAKLTGVDTSKTSKDITVSGATATKGGTITLNAGDLAKKSVTLTTTDLADANNLVYTIGTLGDSVNTNPSLSGDWGFNEKNNTATFTGYATAAYQIAGGSKSVTYNKDIGNKTTTNPAAVMTIKNVTGIENGGSSTGVTVTGNADNKAATMSNGLIPVTFNGNNIAGSNDADTITIGSTGASVKGGKGDDNIKLSSGKDTILYGNGDGNDIVTSFTADSDVIQLTSGKLTSVIGNINSTVIKVGTGSITLNGNYTNTTINIYDSKGTTNLWGKKPKTATPASSDVLFEDNNYSADAAALSDIVEPFKASYTPYDFEAGLDLVKQNSLAPAVTFTGDDKK